MWNHLPRATYFAHRDNSPAPDQKLIEGRVVIVCDSVVNTGRSLRALLREVLAPLQPLRVVVVCVVLQQLAAPELSREFPLVPVVALRVSGNKFKGRGGTDTGNRLFNTTVID